jgi:hypothetical protein
MIGSISCPVPVSSLQTIPSNIFDSYVFGFNNMYYPADTIYPGEGYWLKSYQEGDLILSCEEVSSFNVNRDMSIFNNMNSLTFSINEGQHQTLYFTSDEILQKFTSRSQLPPPFPDNLDIRYQSPESDGAFIAYLSVKEDKSESVPIMLRSLKYPLTISWNLTDIKTQYRLITDYGHSISLSEKGEVILNDNSIDTSKNQRIFVLEAMGKFANQIPSVYGVEQNYPNPFNPVTSISYQIPVESHVILKIYNSLGQEVKTLVNEKKDIGYYSVEWDASNITSGIYFYRLEATSTSDPGRSFTQVKKMILLK